MKGKFVPTLAAVLLLVGCAAGIDVYKLKDYDKISTTAPDKAASATTVGNPWNLAMTQFNVNIVRQVQACGTHLEGTIQVGATTAKALDRDQMYTLDSKGVWATSDISSTLAIDGTSLGLNASSTGVAGSVVTNVVGAVAQIGVAAAVAGPKPVAAPAAEEMCAPEVIAALKELGVAPEVKPTLKQQVASETDQLARATALVTSLTLQEALDASYKTPLAAAIGNQAALAAKLSTDQATLNNDMAIISQSQSITWPQFGSEFATSVAFAPDTEAIAKWLRKPADKSATDAFKVSSEISSIQNKLAVHLAIYRRYADGSWGQPRRPMSGDVGVGIPVRVAVPGRLVACTGAPPGQAKTMCSPENRIPVSFEGDARLLVTDQPILQLGNVYNVALRGGSWKATAATIAMDPTTGAPTSIEVWQKAAAAQQISATASSVAGQLAALPAQLAAAQLASTQAKTSQATAEASMASAVANAQVAGQTAPLVAQAAYNTAANNQLTTLAALATSQANAANVNSNGAMAAQVTVLNAQIALQNAQASEIAAKAALVAAGGH